MSAVLTCCLAAGAKAAAPEMVARRATESFMIDERLD